MRRPATVLQKMLDDLRAIEDDRRAGALVSEALQAVKEFNSEASQLRRDIARRLRAEGLTYPELAEILGVNPSRVPQILQGGPTGKYAKIARDDRDEAPSPEMGDGA